MKPTPQYPYRRGNVYRHKPTGTDLLLQHVWYDDISAAFKFEFYAGHEKVEMSQREVEATLDPVAILEEARP